MRLFQNSSICIKIRFFSVILHQNDKSSVILNAVKDLVAYFFILQQPLIFPLILITLQFKKQQDGNKIMCKYMVRLENYIINILDYVKMRYSKGYNVKIE